MTDSDPNRPYVRDDVEKLSDTRDEPADDRGGFRDTAPNPHGREGAPETATRATGAMVGMFFPTVILAIIAIAIILYFVLR